ncbi:hypothetical protein [Ornithinibacillus sp. JPR2-1]|uniref:hypothetical protein n=1 Tax=Ornithinibacillus sp. JPR2-1 TaxID=2094019 RepID=UPI0031E21B50
MSRYQFNDLRQETLYGKTIYKFTKPYYFKKIGTVKYEYVILSFAFAYGMAFSDEGHHRRNRTGGGHERSNVEVFSNTFLGKLGEFAVYQYFKSFGIFMPFPDITIAGENEWDDYDFEYNSQKIGVKTTKSFGNLLLLETGDWNNNAQYIPNLNKGKSDYNHFLFVRVKYDVESRLRKRDLLKEATIQPELLEKELSDFSYEFDLSYIPIDFIRQVINDSKTVVKGNYLNNTYTELDADNYYIQSGDMIKIDWFRQKLLGN